MAWLIETKRLGLRKLTSQDSEALGAILSDPEVMYAWEHGFTADEVESFLEKNLLRYERDNAGYLAAIEKTTGELSGVMGPLLETIDGKDHMGIAYILGKRYWGKGYATEGAAACLDFAFSALGSGRVIADIRPENLPSRRVAERLNMKICGEHIKHYNGRDMPHLIYEIIKENWKYKQ